ncbi:TolC family protein [Ramlibacter sp.]|uniref:efflux transporter outer membrane subunit n=1 Tax=Ramlibacter sp. TaxID=1917967 RepID=UPI00263829F6|nr:TolC family protein [Ramlibacter sp.]MDB5954710.1 efflux system, outer rane lipoprotein NodT family [Ramlibacter sp.]
MAMPFSRPLAAGTLAALLAACSTSPVGPDYHVPEQALVRQPAAAASFDSSAAAEHQVADAAPLPAHWWRLYQDPALDALVQQALQHNTDLRQAAANLERVQAMAVEAGAAQSVHVGMDAAPVYGHVSGLSLLQPGYQPPTRGMDSVGVTLSYQLDLFGQIRRGIEAAEAGTGSAQAALDLARVNVAGGTARAYALACSAGLRLRTAQHSIALQQQALDVSQRLQQAGRVDVLDVGRAQSQLHQLRATVPALQAQRQGALLQLQTLTGTIPGTALPPAVANCERAPVLAQAIPVGDGAALLRRRPDVREAERELAAATARIGVVTADLYPKIALGLSASSASPMSDFGARDSIGWSAGPLISWTLPNTGAVQARIGQAQAGARGALAHFDGTVLAALRETETALDAYARELDRRAALTAAREAAGRVAEQARRLYRAGKTGSLETLDAERSLAAAEAALAETQAQLADDQIRLFMALGGGWEAPGEQAAAR